MTVNWRDWEIVAQPQSDFARIFGATPTYKYVRKASYRGGSGRRLHHIENLTRAEALHWLARDPHGRSFALARGEPISDLADLLVEASQRPTEKREAPKMHNMDKTLRALGEAGFTRMIEKYAKTVHPTLTKEQAFCKVFLADDAEGAAIRRAWLVSKQGIPAGALDEPTDDDDDENALEELNELAAEERRRNPKLTKAQAFTKAYTDPSNVDLVKRERRANRPRA